MTQIWMDPAELRIAVGMLAEQAQRIQETVTGTRTICQCEVPRSMIGWLDEILVRVTEDALRVAVGYLQEAVDTGRRVQEIEADQSLAASQTSFAGVTSIGGTSVYGGLSAQEILGGTAIVGGSSFYDDIHAPFAGPATMTIGAPSYANFPLMGFLSGVAGSGIGAVGGGSGRGMSGILDVPGHDSMMTILAPSGLTYDNGAYVDAGGDRAASSSLPGAYRDPITREYDL